MTVWTDREILRRTIYSILTCENDGDTVEVIRRACELAGIEMPYVLASFAEREDKGGELGN